MPRKAINEISIDGTDYFMTHDSLCWTLYFSGPKAKRLIGHFSQLSHLLSHMLQDIINTSEASTLVTLKDTVVGAERTVLAAAESLQARLTELTKVEPEPSGEEDDDDDFVGDGLDFSNDEDDE